MFRTALQPSLRLRLIPQLNFSRSLAVLPKIQKAVVFETNGGPLEYRDIPVPKPKPNELLINVLYSGVCHTDLHAWKGDWPTPPALPLVGGHEGSGVVVAMGDNVTGWTIGENAGIKWLNKTCMSCSYCEEGHESNCDKSELSGYTRDGTFQQYATADLLQAVKLPEGTNLAEAAPILCAGVTVYKALKEANLSQGQWVAISGAGGGLGTLAVQYAKAMGFRVLGIDGGEDKGQLVKSLGAEEYIDFTKIQDVPKEVIKQTNGGPQAVLNLSVSSKAIQELTEYVRKTGTIVLVSLPPQANIEASIISTVTRCISIKGSYVGNRADTREAIEFFHRGLVKSPIKIAGLSELPRIYEEMESGNILGNT